MCAKCKSIGFDAYVESLGKLEAATTEIVSQAVYNGAKIVADALRAGIDSVPTTEEKWGTEDHKISGLTPEQKSMLIKTFGIAPMRNEDGSINVKVGWDYLKQSGRWAYATIRQVEYGNSYREPTPFVRRTISKVKKAAEEEMKRTFDEMTDKSK